MDLTWGSAIGKHVCTMGKELNDCKKSEMAWE